MNFEIVQENGITTIKPLDPAINASNSTEFRGKFTDLLNAGETLFILDLSEIKFIDSSGLGAIIALLKQIKANRGQLTVFGIKPTVLNLFKLTRMDQFFEIRNSKEESLEFLSALSKK